MKENAQQYHDLAEQSGFDTKKMLADNRRRSPSSSATPRRPTSTPTRPTRRWRAWSPACPSLADYDVIIDAGGDASDPETAVPVLDQDRGRQDLQAARQPVLPRRERALRHGAEVVDQGRRRRRRQGRVRRGAARRRASTSPRSNEFDKQAKELDASAKQWTPTEQDALTALVVMTPTMSEYFEAWKNSRFVAGDKATEKSFVGASRLQDIADILGGLKLIYANVAAEDRGGEPGAGRPDRPVADRARGLRGAPARPGGGRQEVHRRGRRHARPPRRRTRPRRSPARSRRPPSS